MYHDPRITCTKRELEIESEGERSCFYSLFPAIDRLPLASLSPLSVSPISVFIRMAAQFIGSVISLISKSDVSSSLFLSSRCSSLLEESNRTKSPLPLIPLCINRFDTKVFYILSILKLLLFPSRKVSLNLFPHFPLSSLCVIKKIDTCLLLPLTRLKLTRSMCI